MKLATKTLLACTAAAAFALTANNAVQAEVIALYDFEGATLANIVSKDTSSVTASNLAVGASLAADVPGTGTLIGTGVAPQSNTTEYFRYRYQSLTDDVVFDDDTLTFTVTPGAGQTLDFISLTFDAINFEGGAGVKHTVYSSLVDGTINSATVDKVGEVTTAGGVNTTWQPFSIDLSAYTNVATTTEFRIELFTTGNSGANWNGIDNFTLNATVIPEPGSLALLGLGGLMIARRRRG